MKIKVILLLISYIVSLVSGAFFLPFVLLFALYIFKGEYLKEIKENKHILKWGLIGGALAYCSQVIYLHTESYLNIEVEKSINTSQLVEQAKDNILIVFIICLVAPILEEMIFRRIIFGSLKGKAGVIAAAFISSFLFSVIHFDFHNLFLYMLIGLVFTWIYHKSKSIISAAFSHVAMNIIVLIGLYN